MPQTLVMMELGLREGREERREEPGPGLTASELIHPPSAERDRSSVILSAERQGRGQRRGRSLGTAAPANGSGGNRSSTTIVGCSSGRGVRDRERSQRDTRTLCEPAAGRLHLGYPHTDAHLTSSLFLSFFFYSSTFFRAGDQKRQIPALMPKRRRDFCVGILVDLRRSGLSVVAVGDHLGSGSS